MSVICEAFGCSPSEALRQDWALVRAVLDYRAMEAAKDQHKRDVTSLTQGQANLWIEMVEETEKRG